MALNTRNFYGESGLTSTSANHIANMAKEYYNKLEKEVNNLHFFDVKVSLIGSGEETIITRGMHADDLDDIPAKLCKIAECKSLIAYLREAIKEKDILYKNIQNYKDSEARAALINPVREEYLSQEDILKSWNIGQLNKYYELESRCAVLGKYVHNDGTLNQARKDFYAILQAPARTNGTGRDTVIYNYIHTVESSKVEDLFFKLQDEHRKAQAELNGMKQTIDDQIRKDMIEKDGKYQTALSAYHKELQEIVERESSYKNVMTDEWAKLKIVIPNHLKSIYEEIQKLSS